jgi:hypothetical protein
MIAVGPAGMLYVPNYNFGKSGGSVAIYPPRATTPSLVLTQGLTAPISVAVDAGGNVYVSNRATTPDIVIYPPGSTTPSATIEGSLIQFPANLIFDAAQNLYIADQDNGVLEIPNGSSEPVSLGLKGVTGAVGLALDPATQALFVSTTDRKTLEFASGNSEPLRTLHVSTYACVLASGMVHRSEYLFVPDCSSDNVYLFKLGNGKPVTTLNFSGAGSACCIGIKPPHTP